MKRNEARGGFTLLEILVVLALFVVLLAGVGAVLRLYSGHYTATERRVSSAQLVRSVSQMLSDDLGAAVQDPIQEVGDDPNRQFIRRFGLRGDSRSLQIDVVQPNLFASTATPEENRRIAAGETKSPETRQAPELKTIFYEFVPINATEPDSGASADASSGENALLAESATDSAPSVDGESTLTGSLSAPPSLADSSLSGSGLDEALDAAATSTTENGALGLLAAGETPPRRFARKYGLSRRELDFETPDDDSAQTASASDSEADSGVASLDAGGTLTGAPGTTAATDGTGLGETSAGVPNGPPPAPWLTAPQIALDSDDGTTWAPEVLDCRFSYFDGENWLDSWDSIEKSGLPIAIKVELKLAPLDDVDLYRASPMLFALPLPPTPEELAKLAESVASDAAASAATRPTTTLPNVDAESAAPTDLGSRLTGSLSAPPTSSGFGGSLGGGDSTGAFGASGTTVAASANATTNRFGTPAKFDVFNSYRPLASFRAARAAALGVSTTPGGSLTGTPASVGGLDGATSATGAAETGVSSDLVGGLGGASAVDATSTPELGTDAAFDATFGGLSTTNVPAANLGPVYNDEGICVDYANGGQYPTLEEMATALGVVQPTVREVIAYLPTTPLGRTTTIERRRPTNVRVGQVAVGGPRGNAAGRESSRERRAAGANPYSTGRARRYQERERTERTATDRTARTRERSERNVATRSERNRTAGTRVGVDRDFAERAVPRERGGTERVATNRVLRTRGESGGGTEIDSELAAALDAEGGVFGSAVGPTEEFGGAALVGGGITPDANGLGTEALAAPTGGGLGIDGGLGGSGVATVGGISPFEIVDSQTRAFADESAGFAPDDAANLQTGLIETPTETPSVAAPTRRAQTTKKTQQTWIRGKK